MSNVITLDGPVSSGKNSVGLLFSQKIHYQYVDTGLVYRAFSVALMERGINEGEDEKIADVLHKVKVDYVSDHTQRILLDGVDVTEKLHTPEVSTFTANIASKLFVREIARKIQREIGKSKNTVMSGRDIGTEIFPDADLKFYLTASPEVRARRRYEQLHTKDPAITYERVYSDMIERDRKDMERSVSPLKVPDDAVVVDNTHLSPEESVDEFLKYFNQKGLK